MVESPPRMFSAPGLLPRRSTPAAVTAAAHAAAAVMDFDVVPMIEGGADFLGRHGVGLAQIVQGGVGKHHAPAEGVVGAVALDHGDLAAGVAQLHEQAEIQARGASTYA